MIKYKAMKRKNPKNGRIAYYAAVENEKSVGFDQIADAIQAECTVHRADILAVLATLEEISDECTTGRTNVHIPRRLRKKRSDCLFQ